MNAPEDPFNDERLVSQEPGVLTVWSDIGCPWATLALHTLHTVAVDRDVDLVIDHRAFPLELFNKRGTPRWILDPEIAAIGALVRSLGWRTWSSDLSAYPVTTLPAMAAVQAAKYPAVGGLRASAELDTALRRAFYEDGRCISIHAEILDAASGCSSVNATALDDALQRGGGIGDVFSQWHTAKEFPIQGSPQLLLGDRYSEHNPGVTYHWTAPPGEGFLRFDGYDEAWAERLLDLAVVS
ncbi:DsbA family oxidoreductase [Nocardioides ultimimeridianus]